MVAVGLILEYKTTLKSLLKIGYKFVAFRSTAFDRCLFRKLLWHSLGAVLVTIGVAGELVFETLSFSADHQLKAESDGTVTALQGSNKQLGIDLATAKTALTTKQSELDTKQQNDAVALEAERQNSARDKTEVLAKAQSLADQLGAQQTALNAANMKLEAQRKANDVLEEKNVKTESELINLAVCNAPRVLTT